MSEPPEASEVRAWVEKAREDLRVACVIRDARASASLAAFHLQPAVEKYLKALLAARQVPVPWIHDLDEIAARLPPPAVDLGATDEDLRRLTAYAVAPRYPYFPSAQAERELPLLVEITERVARAVEAALR